jgi:hypothetical protein
LGAFGGVAIGEGGVEFFEEGFGAVFLRIQPSGFFVEVTLPLDVRVLQGVGPGAELAGTGLGEGFEIRNLRNEILESRAAFEEAEHGADFSGGAACDVEKGEEFVGGAALETLCDVVGNGKGAAVELVPFGVGDAILGGGKEVFAAFSQPNGVLPDWETFKALVGHGSCGFET